MFFFVHGFFSNLELCISKLHETVEDNCVSILKYICNNAVLFINYMIVGTNKINIKHLALNNNKHSGECTRNNVTSSYTVSFF
jgi:hypothetical protein